MANTHFILIPYRYTLYSIYSLCFTIVLYSIIFINSDKSQLEEPVETLLVYYHYWHHLLYVSVQVYCLSSNILQNIIHVCVIWFITNRSFYHLVLEYLKSKLTIYKSREMRNKNPQHDDSPTVYMYIYNILVLQCFYVVATGLSTNRYRSVLLNCCRLVILVPVPIQSITKLCRFSGQDR